MRTRREASSFSSGVKAKNGWSYPYAPPQMFIACCLFSIDTSLPFVFNWVKRVPKLGTQLSVNCWRLWQFGARVRSWEAGLQAVRTMRQQAVCRYATLVLWDELHLGSGGVRDGLGNTCYTTAVCIARGKGGCNFYADDLLAGFLCYLTPWVCVRVCVAYVWSGSRWFQVSLSTMRFIWIRNVNAQNPWDVWRSGYLASFPSHDTMLYLRTLVKRQESDDKLSTENLPRSNVLPVRTTKAGDAVEVVETTRVLGFVLGWVDCWSAL